MKLSNTNLSYWSRNRWSKIIATTVFIPVTLATLGLASPQDALAVPGIEVGVLTCESVPGTRMNLVIHSSVDIECVFNNAGVEERYHGQTGIGIGVDLTATSDEKFAFTVFALSGDVTPGAHALTGDYIGGKASAAAGPGVGAAVLIGGGEKNFSLQPLALDTSIGFGAAAGVGHLSIWPEVTE
ncbi:MAG: DUF992 domain-containing protein [Gammaproteobacteria bacterium]|nr:DUF992 domain-containing protein [Gammaproteobacteria bacterium]MCI0591737.1 DUF992 domain-containing protein [Gammaproteobacteria bacterium]